MNRVKEFDNNSIKAYTCVASYIAIGIPIVVNASQEYACIN